MRSRSSVLVPWPGPLERTPGTLPRVGEPGGKRKAGRKREKTRAEDIYRPRVYTSHARTSPIFRTIVVCKSARAHCAARATCTYFIFSSGPYLRSPELFLYVYIYYSLYPHARVYGPHYYAALWRTEIVLELQRSPRQIIWRRRI